MATMIWFRGIDWSAKTWITIKTFVLVSIAKTSVVFKNVVSNIRRLLASDKWVRFCFVSVLKLSHLRWSIILFSFVELHCQEVIMFASLRDLAIKLKCSCAEQPWTWMLTGRFLKIYIIDIILSALDNSKYITDISRSFTFCHCIII